MHAGSSVALRPWRTLSAVKDSQQRGKQLRVSKGLVLADHSSTRPRFNHILT